jgi:hypothetical protein
MLPDCQCADVEKGRKENARLKQNTVRKVIRDLRLNQVERF